MTRSVSDLLSVYLLAREAGLNKRKEILEKYDPPAWLRLDATKMEGEILSLPSDINAPFEINLLVESFSK